VYVRAAYQPFNRWIARQTRQHLPTLIDLKSTFAGLDDTAIDMLALTIGIPEGQRLLSETSNVALKPQTEASLWRAIQAIQPDGMLIFEDLHWFDNASMDVLTHILQSPEAGRYQILMTSRERTRLGGNLGDNDLTTMQLEALDDCTAHAMLSALQQNSNAPDITPELLDRAAGIPLFLEHLSVWQSDKGVGNSDVPSTLTDLLAAQIDATGPAKAVLQCAAVIGQKFDLATLAAIASQNGSLKGRLLMAAACGVVQQIDKDQWVFRHALLRQAAYQGLLRSKRIQYHGQIAAYMQTHQVDLIRRTPSVLTNHLLLAEQFIPAIRNYHRVSQWAMFQGAFEDAEAHITDAIALCNQVPDAVDARALEISCQATRGAIFMQTQGFATKPVQQVFARISELAAQQNAFSADNGPAFYGSFTYALSTGNKSNAEWFGYKLRETAAKVTLPEKQYDLQQAASNADVAFHFYTGNFSGAFDKFAQMRAQYDISQRQSMIDNYGIDGFASAQMFEAVGRAFCGDAQLVSDLNAETHAHQDVLNIPVMQPYALIWGGVALYYGGERDKALRHIAKGRDMAQSTASAFWRLTGAAWQFILDPTHSETEAGLATWEQVLRTHEMIGATLSLPFYKANYARALGRHGRHDDAFKTAQQAAHEVSESGMLCWQAEVLRILAKTNLAIGRKEETETLLENAAKIASQQNAKLWLVRVRLDQYALGAISAELLQDTVARFDQNARLPELTEAKKLLGKS
jgi:tetratricopeptide (TPR) repeat protein